MMSTPAGWYPQPDGRLRYWDGNAWTEHFHDPGAAGDAAKPTAQRGDAGSPDEPSASEPTAAATPMAYGASAPAAYGTPTYGAPAAAPAKKGKGCLIWGLVAVVLVVVLGVVGAIVAWKRISESPVIVLPTTFPSRLVTPSAPEPSETVFSTPDSADTLSVTLGKGFTIDKVTVADGWTVDATAVKGIWLFNNMKLTSAAKDYAMFKLTFYSGDSVIDTALCTVAINETEVTCLPVSKDVHSATRVGVKGSF